MIANIFHQTRGVKNKAEIRQIVRANLPEDANSFSVTFSRDLFYVYVNDKLVSEFNL